MAHQEIVKEQIEYMGGTGKNETQRKCAERVIVSTIIVS